MAVPPPSGPMPPPQPYPGMYYAPMAIETFLTRRNVFVMIAFGVLFMWIGFLIALVTSDPGARAIAQFLVLSAGFFASLSSIAGALGSKRATDMQSLGLLILAGFFLTASITLMGFV